MGKRIKIFVLVLSFSMLLVGYGVYYDGYYDQPYDYYGGFGYPYYYGFHSYYYYPYGHWGTGHRDWDDSHRGGFGGFHGDRDGGGSHGGREGGHGSRGRSDR